MRINNERVKSELNVAILGWEDRFGMVTDVI